MDEDIPQNVERIGGNDWCTETSEGYNWTINTTNIAGILEDL